MNNIEVGRVVVSTAGRDKGELLVISEICGDGYVMLLDGGSRKIANPKKKKIKHLKATEVLLEELADKILKKTILDAEIKKALKALK